MRERNGLRRAAWRELWPASIFALVLALATWAWSIPAQLELREHGVKGSSPVSWLVLILLPAAIYAGLAVGRSPTRALAFMLARPCARVRLLWTRAEIAMASLGIAVALAVAPALAHHAYADELIELALCVALLGLAFAFAVLAALVTDREPLALGVAVLLFAVGPCVMLVACEWLGITPPRVVSAHPIGLIAAIGVAIAACIGAAKELWCEHLPLRARGTIERVMLRASRGWAAAMLFCGALAWHSSAADEGVPMVVLGGDAGGPIVAVGSPGGRVDAVLGVDGGVLLDATASDEEIVRAVTDGERLAVTLTDGESRCRVALLDAQHGERAIDRSCDRLLLSPTGNTLAIVGREGVVYVDTTTATTRRVDHPADLIVVGWLGEELIVHGRESAHDRRVHVGARVLTELPVKSARLSPDGDRLAVRVSRPDKTTYDEGPARIAFIGLTDGSMREHEVALGNAQVVGWLDAKHVALHGYPGWRADTSLVVMSLDEGELHRTRISYAFFPQHVHGPAHGPWLLDRGGLLELVASDGTQLWRESVAMLDRDDHSAHRWAIVAGAVIGIGQDGRRWRHDLPWEVTR